MKFFKEFYNYPNHVLSYIDYCNENNDYSLILMTFIDNKLFKNEHHYESMEMALVNLEKINDKQAISFLYTAKKLI